MPRPLLIFSQSDYLVQIVDINPRTEWQTVQIQVSWLFQKPADLHLHGVQREGLSRFSRTRVKEHNLARVISIHQNILLSNNLTRAISIHQNILISNKLTRAISIHQNILISNKITRVISIHQNILISNKLTRAISIHQNILISNFFFFWFGFYGPFKNISLISSRSFIEGGRKPENPEKNHLTIRKQNLAFPHMTRARLEPQRWET